MMFLIQEMFRSFILTDKIKIGYVFEGLPLPYNRIMPSTRLRVYDIIKSFANDNDFFVEIYKPWKKYDLVVFQKKFDESANSLAKKLKAGGVKIVLDINVNYYDKSFLNEDPKFQNRDVMNFTEICDGVITTTEYIRDYVLGLFPNKNVACIPENIDGKFFEKTKLGENTPLNLTYVGYSTKASEILHIRDILEGLRKKHAFRLLFICEKDPKIRMDGIESVFVKYDQKKIHRQLLDGDIAIYPRDLSNGYNLGHSFTKIGYPMAAGIPIIADAVPSYLGSPAIICRSKSEWETNLENLLTDKSLREKLSLAGTDYCKKNFSLGLIHNQYVEFFKTILK